ncbi:hypothetical protein B0A48_08562 [Cryoendolithus antarcticus]|uniref:Amidohydrolase-related domain-containing protein n=1 Tax=Cryoendolithus antarcticus TaxID=1507870 RepID=A0A1V8T653_9PEZI|nr:hypothetical protein B0A48_08562 [Cryoendolithus antarcticus]
MAQAFLATHGIDLDAELAKMQSPDANPQSSPNLPATATQSSTGLPIHPTTLPTSIRNVSLPSRPGTHDVTLNPNTGKITYIGAHDPEIALLNLANQEYGNAALLAPSLCHPHIHIDKAYLLSHPSHSKHQITEGTFSEALHITNLAKAAFTTQDLLERGQRVVDESVAAGVTHMRAFVEVDAIVGFKCLEAGLELKRLAEREGKMRVQICAFAQLPLFSDSQTNSWSEEAKFHDSEAEKIRSLMREAAANPEVEVLGSTPYVEADDERAKRNVEWIVDLSVEFDKHLDLHLDYNLNSSSEPLIHHVVATLHAAHWTEKTTDKTIVIGHATRLTLFSAQEWTDLKIAIGDLPLHFVGLPTSDLYMLRTPERTRGTLDVISMIREHGLNACLGVNNVGNAFTPQGTCDPLSLASAGVGIYSAGTMKDAEVLYGGVSTRAKAAIGFGSIAGNPIGEDGSKEGEIRVGDPADVLLFGSEKQNWRTRKSVAEAVYFYDCCRGRRGFLGGKATS